MTTTTILSVLEGHDLLLQNSSRDASLWCFTFCRLLMLSCLTCVLLSCYIASQEGVWWGTNSLMKYFGLFSSCLLKQGNQEDSWAYSENLCVGCVVFDASRVWSHHETRHETTKQDYHWEDTEEEDKPYFLLSLLPVNRFVFFTHSRRLLLLGWEKDFPEMMSTSPAMIKQRLQRMFKDSRSMQSEKRIKCGCFCKKKTKNVRRMKLGLRKRWRRPWKRKDVDRKGKDFAR